jgi:hypothetical protein
MRIAITYTPASAIHAQDNAARRRIVRLAAAVYWLLILEGALRRWLLPEYEEMLFFIRVPLVAWCYWTALQHKMWPRPTLFLVGFYAFSIIAIVLVPMQMLYGGYSDRHFLLAAYGWYNYFYYIPLAFLIAEQFSRSDLVVLVRQTAWMSLPMALLVFLQFNAPPSSAINVGFSTEEVHQFRGLVVASERIRPTGTFTSSAGLGDFIIGLSVMLFSAWLLPALHRPVKPALLMASTIALLIMVALSGSRGLFLSSGLMFAAAFVTGYVTKRKRVVLHTSVLVPLLGILFVGLFPLLFPTAFDTFAERWVSAYASESQHYSFGIFGRALGNLYWFLLIIPDTPLLGYLLGMGGNAAHQLGWVEIPDAAAEWDQPVGWAEDPFSQHIVELGPVLGLLYIVFRLAFTLWIGNRCLRATRRRGDPLPLMLFAFVALMMLMAQMTGNGTHIGYTWVFVGLCLAASRPAPTLHRVRSVAGQRMRS